MSSAPASQPSEGDQALPPGRAFLVLIAIIVALAAYIGLAVLLHIAAIFAGSLFLFFWTGVEKTAPAAFVPTLVGALGGIANAALFHPSVASSFGLDPTWAAIAGLIVIVLALYLLLMKTMSVLFNQAYMLFITVAAIPLLPDVKIFASMVEAVFLSAAFFGCIVWILRHIGARRAVNTAAQAIGADIPTFDDMRPGSKW
jgi:hypothetical protein